MFSGGHAVSISPLINPHSGMALINGTVFASATCSARCSARPPINLSSPSLLLSFLPSFFLSFSILIFLLPYSLTFPLTFPHPYFVFLSFPRLFPGFFPALNSEPPPPTFLHLHLSHTSGFHASYFCLLNLIGQWGAPQSTLRAVFMEGFSIFFFLFFFFTPSFFKVNCCFQWCFSMCERTVFSADYSATDMIKVTEHLCVFTPRPPACLCLHRLSHDTFFFTEACVCICFFNKKKWPFRTVRVICFYNQYALCPTCV